MIFQSRMRISGFGTSAFNGVYVANGDTTSVTYTDMGTMQEVTTSYPVLSNGTSLLFAVYNSYALAPLYAVGRSTSAPEFYAPSANLANLSGDWYNTDYTVRIGVASQSGSYYIVDITQQLSASSLAPQPLSSALPDWGTYARDTPEGCTRLFIGANVNPAPSGTSFVRPGHIYGAWFFNLNAKPSSHYTHPIVPPQGDWRSSSWVQIASGTFEGDYMRPTPNANWLESANGYAIVKTWTDSNTPPNQSAFAGWYIVPTELASSVYDSHDPSNDFLDSLTGVTYNGPMAERPGTDVGFSYFVPSLPASRWQSLGGPYMKQLGVVWDMTPGEMLEIIEDTRTSDADTTLAGITQDFGLADGKMVVLRLSRPANGALSLKLTFPDRTHCTYPVRHSGGSAAVPSDPLDYAFWLWGNGFSLVANSMLTLVYNEAEGVWRPACESSPAQVQMVFAMERRLAALEAFHFGTLAVSYTGTAPDGAQWSVDGGTTWHDFSDSLSLVPGTYSVTYASVSGYATPATQSVSVSVGQTASVTAGTYMAIPTTGTVTLTFSGTVPTGAGWTIDGQSYTSGDTATLSPGTYAITYASVEGYDSPSTPTSVTVAAGDSLTLAAEYTAQQIAPSGPSYVVSGASQDAANGTYALVGGMNGRNGSPVFSNGTWYLAYGYDTDGEELGWAVTSATPSSSLSFNHAPNFWVVSNDSSAPPTSGWRGVTVTQGS